MSRAIAGTPTLDAGLLHEQVREDILVPVRSSGGGLVLGIGWRDDDGSGRTRLHLGLPIAVYGNRFGHVSVSYAWDLDATWQRDMADLAGGTLALGPTLSLDVDEFFHADWDDSHIYWQTHWGLGPQVGWRRPLDSGELGLWTTLPVVVLASRPPATWQTKVTDVTNPLEQLVLAHGDPRITSLHEALEWRGGVTWSRLRPGGERTLSAEARFARTNWPEPITVVAVQVNVERRFGAGGVS